MRYLGGINLASVVLASIRLWAIWTRYRSSIAPSKLATGVDAEMDMVAMASLFAANGSQFFLNWFVAGPNGRWIMGNARSLDRISA